MKLMEAVEAYKSGAISLDEALAEVTNEIVVERESNEGSVWDFDGGDPTADSYSLLATARKRFGLDKEEYEAFAVAIRRGPR